MHANDTLFDAPPVTITNAEFLAEVFKNIAEGEVAWVTGFRADPASAAAKWFGRVVDVHGVAPGLIELPACIQPPSNTFYSISTFKPAPSVDKRTGATVVKPLRRISHFGATHILVLDDIGTGPGAKIGPDKVKLPPSVIVETSPQNFQCGYLLDTPITDKELVLKVQLALIHQGLLSQHDPGMANVTRYMRLPSGSNTKAKYGKPFRHVLRHWQPELRYSVDDIVTGYGLDLDAIQARGTTKGLRDAVAIAAADDAWLEVLSDLGMVRSEVRGEWVDIECPWRSEHTDGADTGAAYRIGGGYRCHHGHCTLRSFADLKDYLQRAHGVDVDAVDRSQLPGGKRPRERMKELRAAGTPPITAYRTVITEYGARGVYSVVYSALAAKHSADWVERLVRQLRPDDDPAAVHEIVARAATPNVNADLAAGL